MRQLLLRAWEPIRILMRRGNTLSGSVLSLIPMLLQHKVARRRWAIVAAAVLVFAYAGGVLSYVMLTPDIGVRSAFTPAVNHFNPDFLFPTDSPNAETLQRRRSDCSHRRSGRFQLGANPP